MNFTKDLSVRVDYLEKNYKQLTQKEKEELDNIIECSVLFCKKTPWHKDVPKALDLLITIYRPLLIKTCSHIYHLYLYGIEEWQDIKQDAYLLFIQYVYKHNPEKAKFTTFVYSVILRRLITDASNKVKKLGNIDLNLLDLSDELSSDHPSWIGRQSHQKGKTYEELYGVEKAKEKREHLSNVHKGKSGIKKGTPFEKIHGAKSEEIREKIRRTVILKGCRPPSRKGKPAWNKGLRYKRKAKP